MISMSGHVVILNLNRMTRGVVRELQAGVREDPLDVVLVVQNMELWENRPEWRPKKNSKAGLITIFGSPSDTEVLEHAGMKRAKAAVILTDPAQGPMADAPSTLTAMLIEKQNPQVHTVIELQLSVNREHLKATEVDEVVCLGEISEMLLARSCITPGIMNIFSNLLLSKAGTANIYTPDVGKILKGQTFRELAKKAIQREAPFIIIGFIKNRLMTEEDEKVIPAVAAAKQVRAKEFMHGSFVRKFVINPSKDENPGKDTPLDENDELVIISYEKPNHIGLLF